MDKLARFDVCACITVAEGPQDICACLESVQWCDEILVVDPQRTVRSRSAAWGFGVRVVQFAANCYRTQRQFAVEHACCDWVLCLNGTERASQGLHFQVDALRSRGFPGPRAWTLGQRPLSRDPNAEAFKRIANFTGEPEYPVRLFDRRFAGWVTEARAEQVAVRGAVGNLTASLQSAWGESVPPRGAIGRALDRSAAAA